MTINHWQSWTLFYVTKKGDIACIRRTRLLTKKEMKSKSGRQKTSSVKIEKWKVVQNIKSCLGNLYSLKGKKMLSINNRHKHEASFPRSKQTNKTQPRDSGRFFNQSEKAEDFPSLCDYFKAIYTCVSFCSSTLYQVKRAIILRLMLLSDAMTLLTLFRLQSNKVKLFSKTARFLSL